MKSRLLASCCLILLGCGPGTATEEAPPKLNLLMISLDTLRADHLGCYGYVRDTSPALDAFAKRCVRFKHAVAPAPWTLPSHVSLLSGLLPSSHRVHNSQWMPGADTHLLAELLYPAGWYTFGITDGGYVSFDFGFDRGFRAFYDQNIPFNATVRNAETYITDRKPFGPWFGFLHTYDIHCPYDPAEPFRSMFQSKEREEIDIDGKCGNPWLNDMHLSPEEVSYVSDRYDGGIREVDASLGKLFQFLEEGGWLANTVIVITSDHGEEFMEHGQIGHERSLQRELLEIPLLLYAPNLAPGVVDSPVSLVDVLPTVLELLGQAQPQDIDGRSLLGLLDGSATPALGQPSTLRWQVSLDAWWTPDELLIVNQGSKKVSLFQFLTDPTCNLDCSGENPTRVRLLQEALKQRLSQAHPHDARKHSNIDEEQASQLRGLGYAGESRSSSK